MCNIWFLKHWAVESNPILIFTQMLMKYLTHWNNSCSLLHTLAHLIFIIKTLRLISWNYWYNMNESLTGRILKFRNDAYHSAGVVGTTVQTQSWLHSGVTEWRVFPHKRSLTKYRDWLSERTLTDKQTSLMLSCKLLTELSICFYEKTKKRKRKSTNDMRVFTQVTWMPELLVRWSKVERKVRPSDQPSTLHAPSRRINHE